jgi:hypothetical protein
MLDTWHSPKDAFQPECIHCQDSYPESTSEHYTCVDGAPCQDCEDDALYAAENVAAGWGAHGEEPYDWEE